MRKIIIVIAGMFMLVSGISSFAQGFRKYLRVSQTVNTTVRKYDTLPVMVCYNLDATTSIGLVQRKLLADMWVAIFKNGRNDLNTYTCDTMVCNDTTHFYFYHTGIPGDGMIILMESKYSYDSELRLYLFRNGAFTRLGRIDVDLDDARQVRVNYPVSEIFISTDGKNYRVDFGKRLVYRISRPYEPKDYYLIYDGVSRLLPVINGKVEKALW